MRYWMVVLALAVSVCCAEDNVLTAQEKADGWKLLFDGKSTTGWVNRGKTALTADLKGWTAENGEFVCNGGREDAVYSAEQFEDFEITLDWKSPPKGNSGLFFRLAKIEDFLTSRTEVQLGDSRNEKLTAEQKIGGLYMLVAPPADVTMKQDEWNTTYLRCDGSKLTCKLNGKTTFDIDTSEEQWKQVRGKIKFPLASLPRKGYFILQDHGDKFWFKNIKVRPLAKSDK